MSEKTFGVDRQRLPGTASVFHEVIRALVECAEWLEREAPHAEPLARARRALKWVTETQTETASEVGQKIIAAAKSKYERSNNNVEIDERPIISRGVDGAFVQAWVWVDNEDAGIGCNDMEKQRPVEIRALDWSDPDYIASITTLAEELARRGQVAHACYPRPERLSVYEQIMLEHGVIEFNEE